MMRGRASLIASLVSLVVASAIARTAVSHDAARQSAVDPTLELIQEDDFLRGISDLGLERALDDLERTEPAASAADGATAQLRSIARWRMALRSPSTAYALRLDALDQLRKARESLIAANASDTRVVLWLADGAEDEFVLGFLGLDGGPEAIAGSPLPGVLARAQASLARVRTLLARASKAQALAADRVQDSALAHRLAEDARGRRPFLAAAVDAFSVAIDRTSDDPVVVRGRPAAAAPLHSAIVELRSRIPARLRPEADLAEVAAAATALRLDDARFGAARILLTNDAVLATLSRILVADGLVSERRGSEALQQLVALNMTADMPTGLRLLAADAFVRTRVRMGKSAADATTLDAWIVTLRSALPTERAAVRRAVLERIAGALRSVAVTGTLPSIATIACAGDALMADGSALASEAILQSFADQTADSEAQRAALVVLADVYSAHGEWGRTADALRLFAQCASHEPSASAAIEKSLEIEIALDRARPDARASSFEETLQLALTRFGELPTRTRSAAQLLALQVVRTTDQLVDAPVFPSADRAAAILSSAVQLRDLEESARGAGFDAGPRVDAAVALATIANDLLSPDDPPRAEAPPTRAQWDGWTSADARRILRLRLEGAALHADDYRSALQKELESIPPSLLMSDSVHACPTLLQFLQRLVEGSIATHDGAGNTSASVAMRALAAAEIWEKLHPTAAVPSTDAQARAHCVVAADAALIAHQWDSATARAQLLAAQPSADRSDLLRVAKALSQGSKALDEAGDLPGRDALRNQAMDAAKLLATRVARGTLEWWTAQVIQVELAAASGRGGEPLQARIARLRVIDPELGGEPHKSALEKFARTARDPNPNDTKPPL